VLSALEELGLSRRVAVSAAGEGLVGIDARFSGGINDLLRAISSVTIRDLTISEPDLEEAVLGLYDGEQGNHGGSHG
jgi:ABC-2 type transport system ATP-binding protein